MMEMAIQLTQLAINKSLATFNNVLFIELSKERNKTHACKTQLINYTSVTVWATKSEPDVYL